MFVVPFVKFAAAGHIPVTPDTLVTSTVTVQVFSASVVAAMLPLPSWIKLPPAAALSTGFGCPETAPQVVIAFDTAAIRKPVGNVSVKSMPVMSVLLRGLVMVKRNLAMPPWGIAANAAPEASTKALVRTGCTTFVVNVAVAGVPV